MKLINAPPKTVQNIIFPSLTWAAPTEMYVRLNELVRYHLSEPLLIFKDGGRAYFDTFYNGLTLAAWKGHCNVAQLSLTLSGKGRFLLRFGLHRFGQYHRWLDETEIFLSDDEPFTIPLTFWPQILEGMLYFCCEALGEATLKSGGFTTTTPPVRPVRLAVVITHFHRKHLVLPALRRINKALLVHEPQTRANIELVVIDNSRDILASDVEGVTVIPNRNLGGSGGFMRGLLYAKDNGFSHSLFMDDDASCEVESLLRCYKLLQHATSDNLAVAGSLLRESEPYRIFEKGARFDGICRPLKQGLDMRQQDALLDAEHVHEPPDYGGWWFFACRIASVKHYAFPFFVRGDDVQFSTLNKFEILTVNGVGCWGEDFSLKSGPMTEYLDVRYHILQNLCILRASRIATARMLCRYFFFAALSYKYGTAQAIILAMQDVMKGPAFFLQDMEMQQKRAEIQHFAAAEKMAAVDKQALYPLHTRPEYEPWPRRLFRGLTLNGMLLPSFLLKDGTIYQHKGFSGSLRNVFRFGRVLYEHAPSRTGYVATHDKRQFFSALVSFGRALMNFIWSAERLRATYLAAIPDMTTEAFWRKIYADDPVPEPLVSPIPEMRPIAETPV